MKNRIGRKDVAALAGVSVATVSYVLNNSKKVTPAVKQRVLDAAKELNYTPNIVAQSLSTKKTRHVALIIDNLKNPHFCELLEGAQAVASQNGYIISVIAVDNSNISSITELISRGVDGIINPLRQMLPDELVDFEIPEVYEGKHLKRDYYPAMLEAVKLLKQNGHRRIAFLSGIPLNAPDHGRLCALKKALSENGLPVDPELFIEGNGDYKTDEQAGKQLADALLRKHRDFTAVIAINDLVAIGAMRSFAEKNLSVPGDISVVGCDNLRMLDYLPTALSSIDTHSFETGKILMSALLAEIDGKEWEIPTAVCDFINRESISAAKQVK